MLSFVVGCVVSSGCATVEASAAVSATVAVSSESVELAESVVVSVSVVALLLQAQSDRQRAKIKIADKIFFIISPFA